MNVLLTAYEYYKYESANTNTFAALDRSSSMASKVSDLEEEKKGCCVSEQRRQNLEAMIASPYYEIFINFVGITNILSIMIRQMGISDSTYFYSCWIITNIVINFMFSTEIILEFFVHGIVESYQNNFRVSPESLC